MDTKTDITETQKKTSDYYKLVVVEEFSNRELIWGENKLADTMVPYPDVAVVY